MASLNFILMADIIGSRKVDQQILISTFREVVKEVNQKNKKDFLSPLTITLGDEFQSIVRDLIAGLNVMIAMEEKIILRRKVFKLRYVLLEGAIETEVNPKIAYEMLGPGLTSAREHLAELKSDKRRFYFSLLDKERGTALNEAFFVLQNLIDAWKADKDFNLVSEFLQLKDYKQIALELSKERSLIWKRKRSLRIEEYFSQKEVIKYIGGGSND
jgi:hypothetical protein